MSGTSGTLARGAMRVPLNPCGWEWARQDSNLGPTDYESAALTAELRARRPQSSAAKDG
jgi:hypothetical protein